MKGWETFVRRLYNEGNKVIVTGSNARMLSRELGTHLTGRYIAVEISLFLSGILAVGKGAAGSQGLLSNQQACHSLGAFQGVFGERWIS